MIKIETGLHAHHASLQASFSSPSSSPSALPSSTSSSSTQPSEGGEEDEARVIETPFAKVNSVVEGSPAHAAGLRAGDRIRAFGAANWMNHEKLTKVAEVVQRSEGVSYLLSFYPSARPLFFLDSWLRLLFLPPSYYLSL